MNTLNKDDELQCYLCPFCRPIIFGSESDQDDTPYPWLSYKKRKGLKR